MIVVKSPDERAHILEKNATIAEIHAELAGGGQSAVPTNLDTELHYTCFVAAPEAEFRERASGAVSADDEDTAKGEDTTGMRLVELDGMRQGPVDRGECHDLLQVRSNRLIILPW